MSHSLVCPRTLKVPSPLLDWTVNMRQSPTCFEVDGFTIDVTFSEWTNSGLFYKSNYIILFFSYFNFDLNCANTKWPFKLFIFLFFYVWYVFFGIWHLLLFLFNIKNSMFWESCSKLIKDRMSKETGSDRRELQVANCTSSPLCWILTWAILSKMEFLYNTSCLLHATKFLTSY